MNRAAGKLPQKKAPKLPQQKEFFRLKYLRFKCRDIHKTLDFYKSLGMIIDYEGIQESFKIPVPGKDKVKTMESDHLKKTSQEEPEPEIETQEQTARIFAFSFAQLANGNAAKETQSQHVQLIFEEDLEYFQELQINQLKEKTEQDETKPIQTEKSPPKRQYEYLVVYVHFLSRLLKRMESKGFEIVLDITSFENVKIAILKDPNNIQIRLMEMPDTYLNEHGSKQWFAKLGYYTLPSSNADQTVLMYESYFQTKSQKQAQAQKTEKETKNGLSGMSESIHSATTLRKLGPAQTVKQALTKSGFRLVDMDEFVVGLTNSVFYWLGNEMRTATCCLCVTEVSNADTGVAYTYHDPETSPLFSIGFEVASIDSVVSRLKYDSKDTLVWDPFRYRMARIAARFLDNINGVQLELFSTKMDTAQVQNPRRQARLPALPAKVGTTKEDSKEEIEFVIDINHLKGHARTLSAGAISCPKGYGYLSLYKEGPVPQPPLEELPTKSFPRKGKFINSILTTPLQSELNLANKKQDHTKRFKDKDEMMIEQMLNREKSKST